MNGLLRSSRLFFKRNSSTILTCIGGIGVVATSIMAVKATPKALTLLEKAKAEKGEDLTKLETIKVVGPVYIPAITTGVSTLICIFGANALNKHQQAALVSAYALADNSYKEYKKKVIDLYGEDVDRRVREELAKDNYEDADIQIGNDKILFYDDFSNRYFESTMEDVIKAEYEINKKISTWGGAYVNEFYEFLNIPTIDGGNELGWSEGGMMDASWSPWLDFYHEKVVMDDGLECYIVTMSSEPVIDYDYY